MQTLREARRSRAWSIRELSDQSGVATATIVSAEKGKLIRLLSIRKLSESLGVDPVEIKEFRAIIYEEYPDVLRP
jgi:transcriptional regulator with XRE-family HTH domain